jgi:hypothetical protein
MSEAAKLLFDEKNKQLSEKDKTILESQERVSKLEEKLEAKCSLFIEAKVRLEERDK